jgi:hypothetical protein
MQNDEGREKQTCEHTSRHTSPEMANSRTLAKHRVHHLSKAPCLHLAKKYFDCQKTKGAGFKLLREAARSFNSRELSFEIWEREAAPAVLLPDIAAIYGRFLSEFAAKANGR